MIKIKACDRVDIRTHCGIKNVKCQLYKGFAINQDWLRDGEGRWNLTVLEGKYKGVAIVSYSKKDSCRKLADKLLNIFGRTNITVEDVKPYVNLIKKCGTVLK